MVQDPFFNSLGQNEDKSILPRNGFGHILGGGWPFGGSSDINNYPQYGPVPMHPFLNNHGQSANKPPFLGYGFGYWIRGSRGFGGNSGVNNHPQHGLEQIYPFFNNHGQINLNCLATDSNTELFRSSHTVKEHLYKLMSCINVLYKLDYSLLFIFPT